MSVAHRVTETRELGVERVALSVPLGVSERELASHLVYPRVTALPQPA